MIVILALLFRRFLNRRLVDRGAASRPTGASSARWRATPRWTCPSPGGTIWQRLRSPKGFTAIANYFVMDWAAIWKDIVGGLLDRRRARRLGAELLLAVASSSPTTRPSPRSGGRSIGPLVAMISFVCSIGNVPLAAVLWNGGISFGGVIAFIFADLIVLPILNIYRKYYGLTDGRASCSSPSTSRWSPPGSSSSSSSEALGLVPDRAQTPRSSRRSVTWNYTTVLNIIFLALAAVLLWRFLRTGGLPMLRMMNKPMGEHA